MIVTALDFSVFLILSTLLQIVKMNDLNPYSNNLSDASSPLGLLIGNKFTSNSSVNIPPVVAPNHSPHEPLPHTDTIKLPIGRTTQGVDKTSTVMNKLSTNKNLGQQEYIVANKFRNSSDIIENNSNSSSDSDKNITSLSTKATTTSSSPTSTFSSIKISDENLAKTKAITTKHDLTTMNNIQKTRPAENTNLLKSTTTTKFNQSTKSKLTTPKRQSVTKSTKNSAFVSVEKDMKSTSTVDIPLLNKAEYKLTSITTGHTTHVETTHDVMQSTSDLSVTKSLTTDVDIKSSKVIDIDESRESKNTFVTDGFSIQTSTETGRPLLKKTKDIRNTTNSVIKTSVEYSTTTTTKGTPTPTSNYTEYSKKVISRSTDPTSPIRTEEQTKDVNTSLKSTKSDSDKYWPVAMAITIGVPAVIVIGVTISVINRKRNLEKAHSTLLNGYITPPSEYEV